jgi:hypothetical protein
MMHLPQTVTIRRAGEKPGRRVQDHTNQRRRKRRNETERDNSMKDKNDKRDKNDKQEAKFGVLDVALYIHNFRGESISVREWQFVQYA